MNDLIKIIESCINETFLDEDGDRLTIKLREAGKAKDILNFELSKGIQLPDDLKKLLLFSNGMNFLGLRILSLEEIEFFPHSRILSFHNWEDGDFDCISINGDYPEGTILFMFHSEDNLEPVCNNLVEWFKEVILEIKKIGSLRHPLDYSNKELEGMYKNISKF